ncbi:hypothetical protein BGZ83_005005 [Gryganskiella cystojenkinii]|nr:hypothetical protein BGZ83_005005 [Gryganskiella cystojenkinii]
MPHSPPSRGRPFRARLLILGFGVLLLTLITAWSVEAAEHTLPTNTPTTIANATSSVQVTSTSSTLATVNSTTATTNRATSTATNATMTVTLTTSTAVNGTSSPSATSTLTPPTDNSGIIYGGAAVGGLVLVVGLAIGAFRCTLNRKDRRRRDKEYAATLALDNRNDPILTPRKGYMELGDDPPSAPGSGRLGAANLSRHGSQDAYYKEQGYSGHSGGSDVGAGDYYNQHYVQERYGGANQGGGGFYEETELSVIGGATGRGNVAYPASTVPPNHYGGYNDYGHQGGDYNYQGGA